MGLPCQLGCLLGEAGSLKSLNEACLAVGHLIGLYTLRYGRAQATRLFCLALEIEFLSFSDDCIGVRLQQQYWAGQ